MKTLTMKTTLSFVSRAICALALAHGLTGCSDLEPYDLSEYIDEENSAGSAFEEFDESIVEGESVVEGESIPDEYGHAMPDGALASSCTAYPSKAACDGHDPGSTGCSAGAKTVKYKNMYWWKDGRYIGRLELRWSPTCKTNWARVSMVGEWPVEELTIKRSSDGTHYTNSSASTNTLWTKMVYSPTEACAYTEIDQGAWVYGTAGWICA